MKKLSLIPFLLLFLTACGDLQTRPEKPTEALPPVEVNVPMPQEIIVNYDELKQRLKIQMPEKKLGYLERAFNTCAVESGFSSSKNCQQMYLAIIHYRLRCRFSEGTVSEAVTDSDMKAIANQSIIWTIKNKTGMSLTDDEGYAEIHQVFSKSPRGERLKLLSNNDFLYMRVNEITSVVAPSPWCN
jgi:hypothetical protein